MILVRNVFQLKFGKAKEAVAVMKEQMAVMKKVRGDIGNPRLLTDLTGNFYTLVLEFTYSGLSELEKTMAGMMGTSEFQQIYQRFVPLVETGHREIFTIVE